MSTDTDTLDARRAALMAATLGVHAPAEGAQLPALWHWAWFSTAHPSDRLGRDGHPAPGVVLPDTGLPRRMWAGGRLAFHRPLLVGATLTRTVTVGPVVEKSGRTGRLAFLTQRATYADADGPCLTDEIDLVFREDARPRSGEPPGFDKLSQREGSGVDKLSPRDGSDQPSQPTASRTITPDAVQLFRYSALTFNGHRIHYDADYARDVEGYAGVVIHGPLLATWLAALATEVVGPLRSFSYRGVRASTLGMTLGVHAGLPDADGAVRLWVTQPDGGASMTATAMPA